MNSADKPEKLDYPYLSIVLGWPPTRVPVHRASTPRPGPPGENGGRDYLPIQTSPIVILTVYAPPGERVINPVYFRLTSSLK